MSNPSNIIRFDKISGKLDRPTLLLKTRTGSIIGEINYTNLQISFVGKGLDEISFEVHKVVNGKEWEHWDKLIDLCIIDYKNYGQFEADVSINDENESIKTVCCKSLETELGQQIIREGHFNDEQDILYNEDYAPTVLYNETDTKHSLLHRIIKDKAPHWSIGEVSKFFNIDGKVYAADKLQRTFTVDGTSIYDFLDGDVSEEFSCVFTFDTYNRLINCYNLEECVYDTRTCTTLPDYYYINGVFYNKYHEKVTKEDELADYLAHCDGIGEDTNIFLTKAKLSQSFMIDSDKDAIKNCFYVTGGDDIISNYIGTANVTGSNYIYLFSNFQYEDMGEELAQKMQDYSNLILEQNEKFTASGGVYIYDENCSYNAETDTCVDASGNIVADAIHDGERVYVLDPLAYYKNDTAYDRDQTPLAAADFIYTDTAGLFTKYCQLTDRIYYLEHSKFPDTAIDETTAEKQLAAIKEYFSAHNVIIQASCTNTAFAHVTGNIKSMLKVVCDNRYTVDILSDSAHPTSCSSVNNSNSTGTWSGYIRLTRDTDATDTMTSALPVAITIKLAKSTEENVEYCKQKMDIAIAAMDISELHFSNLDDKGLDVLLRKYNVTSLKSFYEGFSSCLSTLTDLYNNLDIEESDIPASASSEIIRSDYTRRCKIAKDVYDEYTAILNNLKAERELLEQEIAEFRKQFDMPTYFGAELYKQFRSYVREDEYNNANYVSDGLNDSEILAKCKELLHVANKELSNACNIQKVINGSLNNIFALKELAQLHSRFALYNYVRVKTDDHIYKLRLMEIRFSDQTPESIDVTFSDQVVSADGKTDDVKSILESSQSIATSYSSTVKQSQQGVQALNTFDLMQKEGFDSSLYLVKNSNTEEVTIDRNGVNCKSMLDDGIYSDNQCQINANGLYLTKDAWSTVSTALGRFKYNDQWVYGLNAGVILGELVVTKEMQVRNSSSSVIIDEDGIAIEGGYLHMSNGTYSVEIDPTHTGSDTKKGYIFSINEGNSTIMGVTDTGDGYFCGEIYATKGNFSGNITSTATINGGTISGGTINGGTISIGSNFSVDSAGLLKCSNADITGKITATSGSFSGNITSTATISGGTISGSTISGGNISIGSNFSVDSTGNINCNNASISGTIIASSGSVIGGWSIKSKKICGGDENTGVAVMQLPSDTTTYTFAAGGKSHDSYQDCPFRVTKQGKLYAQDAVFENSIIMYDEVNAKNITCMVADGGINFPNYCFFEKDVTFNQGLYSNASIGNYSCIMTNNIRQDVNESSSWDEATGSVGISSYRWSKGYIAQLYYNNSSIGTSDRNKKDQIVHMGDAQEKLFHELKPVTYKFKGDEHVRIHYGFISQDVEESMLKLGMTGDDFAGFCKDPKVKKIEEGNDLSEETVEYEYDADGNPVYDYALRYDEFIALNTHMIQKAYQIIEQQQQEINALKDSISSLQESL